MLDLGRSFLASVERSPEEIAVVDGRTRFTYGQWFEKIRRVAGGLSGLGIGKRDHLLVVLQNRWEMATLHWACQFLGAIVTPLNWRAKAEEVEYCAQDSQARVVVFEGVSEEAVTSGARGLSQVSVGEVEANTLKFAELTEALPPPVLLNATAEDLSLMLYASGTTGKPKGVPRRHRHERTAALAHVAQNLYRWGERTLGVMPLYHTMGVRSLLAMTLVDGRFVCVPKFDPAAALKYIAAEKITNLYLVPTLYHVLLSHPDFRKTDITSVRKHPDAFYWVDYSCLPQSRETDDENLFTRTLPKIASIQAKASTIVILAPDFDERLWCYIEHLAAVFFAQTNVATVGRRPRTVEYLGPVSPDCNIIERVQMLQEPAWDKLKVTKPSEVPGVKYNYRWLTNLVRFQLYDRFSELRESLPGSEWYSGLHYPQSAFGINYSDSLAAIRSLFEEFGGNTDQLFTENSLLWLAQRFSWSASPDDYRMEAMRFSPSLLFSEDMVGWFALLLGMIRVLNHGNEKIVNLRELYATMVLISLFK